MQSSRGVIVLLLALVLFINYIDRGALPTAAHLIRADLHFDEAQLGWLFSAFFWTYSLTQIPIGWLAERYGAHRVLAGGLALWAAATIMIGTATSFAMLLGLRLLLGIGESVGFPCVSKLMAQVVPVKSLGTANGIVAFGYLFGPAIGTYFGGMLMDSYGWRVTFFCFGGLSLFWLLPWARVRLPPLAAKSPTGEADSPSFREILNQRSLWGTCLGLFSNNYTFYFMLTWLPFYLVSERGFSTVQMAQLAGSGYVINAVSALTTGWAIDRYMARGGTANSAYKFTMVFAHSGAVICMLIMGWGNLHWAIGGMYGYQVLCGISSPGCYGIPQILAGPKASGRWVGVHNCFGNFAGVIAPALTGWIVLVTHQFFAAFMVASGMSLLGVAGWWLMVPKLQELPWSCNARKDEAGDAGTPGPLRSV